MFHDVFINHRGCDDKYKLVSIIYHTLELLGLQAFLDVEEKSELGGSLTVAIKEAMRTAPLHVAIFSQTYAESPWCLSELSFMVKTGKTIIPVFYHVTPVDLRRAAHKKGIYASAFSKYEEKGEYPLNILEDWKTALQKVSFLSGYMLNRETDDEGKLLKYIVEKVRTELKWVLLKNIVEKVLRILKKLPLEVAKHPVTPPQQPHTGSITCEVSRPNYVPMELIGGRGGGPWDDGIYSGIRKIVMRFGTVIDSIKVQYDLNGRSIWSKHHGGTGGAQAAEVEFDYPREVLVSISGQYYNHNGKILLTSLTFHTNQDEYGPFGNSRGCAFRTKSEGHKILGFYGMSGCFLDGIGVHLVKEHP